MINMSHLKSEYEELIVDIQNFIKASRNPEKIKGKIIFSDFENNQIKVRFSKKLYLSKGALLIINNQPGSLVGYSGKDAIIQLESSKSFFSNDIVHIDTSRAAIILNRLEKSVDKIDNNDLNDDNRRILNFLLGKGRPVYENKGLYPFAENLNENQFISVEKSLNAQDFHLIIGPPGTGKTFVIEEIIRQLAGAKEKVLVTAWTNLAVDNILERLSGLGEDLLLRVGSEKGIKSENLKYSVFEKRKNHKDWNEVKIIENDIINKKKELKNLFNELKAFSTNINKLKTKKSHISTLFENTRECINGITTLKAELTIDDFDKRFELSHMEEEMELLESSSNEYVVMAENLLDLESLENSLPDNDEFYLLESDLEKMRGKGLVKKVSRFFDKSGFEQFQNDLNEKEAAYSEMVNEFNNYWDLKDDTDKKLQRLYGEGPGNPVEDALLCQLDLCRKLEDFIILKKEYLNCKLCNEENKLILDSFQVYKKSLEKKAQLTELKINNINSEMYIKIKKKDEVSRAIDNIKSSIELLEADKLYLIHLIDNDIYDKANFIFSTVISSASPLLDQKEFDVMIMDEASQVASYMSLIPLLKCKKFILVGDNKQLEPIGEMKLKPELNQSIFNRLIEKYPDSKTFLDTQYRMNKNIAHIASLLFYDGKLKTYPPIGDQKIDCSMENYVKDIIPPESPVTFIDTSSLKFYEDGTENGCENTREAFIVNKLVSNLMDSGVNAEDIGIISPYVRQKKKIKEILENDVEVDTVHRFQGREKDIIIMSFCSSKLGPLNRNLLKFIEKKHKLKLQINNYSYFH